MMKTRAIFLSLAIEVILICFVSIACALNPIGFALSYNLGYGILASIIIPLMFAAKNRESLMSFGIKPVHSRQFIVILVFVLFSLGGQLVPLLIAGTEIQFRLLPICFLPLIMTTFFEEFLFRGFIQTRIEQHFHWIAAILFSGALFSLYHLGYPGFRNWQDLLLLFAVGTGFAISYKLSGNNLWVSYFVNLPNAFVTYILKSEQFPVFTWTSSLYAAISIVIIVLVCFFYRKTIAQQRRASQSAVE